MMIKKLAIGSLFITSFLLLQSCSSSKPYAWYGYDNTSYYYLKYHTDQYEQKLMDTYQKMIDHPNGTRHMPPPGTYADYGYLLLKKGKIKQGLDMMKLEAVAYPESAKMIHMIVKRYEKELERKEEENNAN